MEEEGKGTEGKMGSERRKRRREGEGRREGKVCKGKEGEKRSEGKKGRREAGKK